MQPGGCLMRIEHVAGAWCMLIPSTVEAGGYNETQPCALLHAASIDLELSGSTRCNMHGPN